MQELILMLMFLGFLFDTLRRNWLPATLVICVVTAITVISGGSWLWAACITTTLVVVAASVKSVAIIGHIQNS